ncbi:MAG: hypothetical protein ACJ754_25195 [Pyrinomonadaceae bacterium]
MGAIVGGFDLGKVQGLWVGAVAGFLMAVLFVWRSEQKYFYEGGYFDRQLFFGSLLNSVTWILGLAIVAVVASAAVHRLLAPSR